jgi:hypothetical protein
MFVRLGSSRVFIPVSPEHCRLNTPTAIITPPNPITHTSNGHAPLGPYPPVKFKSIRPFTVYNLSKHSSSHSTLHGPEFTDVALSSHLFEHADTFLNRVYTFSACTVQLLAQDIVADTVVRPRHTNFHIK